MKKKCDIARQIEKASHQYADYIDYVGNECAMTDRIIENIVKLAKELEQVQEEQLQTL
jgi:hypothetical protein